MYKYNKYTAYLSVLLMVAITAGCKNYKAVTVQSTMTLPSTYRGGTDTLNSAGIPINTFFADTSLRKLIDTALKNNFDMQAALQRIEMASATLQYNKSLRLPSVNLNAIAGIERYGDYTMNGVGNYDTNLSPNINGDQRIPNPTPDYFIGLRSSWEVPLWGKLKNQNKAALARFLATQSGYRMVVTELSAQIATAYYELLALDKELSIIRKNIVLQQNALEIVKIQKDGARATELAVQQFAAQLANTQALQYSTLQQITETENRLHLLTGKFTGTIHRDTSITALPLPGKLKTGVPTQLLLNRPDIRQAELELTALNADIRSARAAFFPSLTLTPYAGYNSFKAALLFNPSSAVFGLVGGLTAPVFNRKKIKTDYNYKVAEAKQALYQYQKTVLSGYQEVMNGLNGMENYSKYYQLKQQEFSALNNAVSVANDLYLLGRASYLEVITAQRNVLDAELQLASTKKNIYLSEVGLYRALGGGWR
ncbi:TolC family protein [Mucilaginibacter lutimaris]|uniref:TolC family protein n=1 Tax=Mucilaginibacter lutimaris TaxID=931629 RepID=A0ABW2Z9H3_9SPHI